MIHRAIRRVVQSWRERMKDRVADDGEQFFDPPYFGKTVIVDQFGDAWFAGERTRGNKAEVRWCAELQRDETRPESEPATRVRDYVATLRGLQEMQRQKLFFNVPRVIDQLVKTRRNHGDFGQTLLQLRDVRGLAVPRNNTLFDRDLA